MDVSLCVNTHRLHSGWTHKFWADLPKRAGQSSCCWQTTPVCCATWLINKWSQKQRVWLYVRFRGWPVLMPSLLWAGGPNGLVPALVEGKLISAILHNSFNTYQKFILHHDLSTSHSCVGNIYPHFSWMTVTETPTANHLGRWNPRLCWGNGHSGKGIYFDAITPWTWHMQFQQLP